MTIVEYYLNLINEASINLQKAQKLITDTVCAECKKNPFKRGCMTCAVKRKKTFLTFLVLPLAFYDNMRYNINTT